MGMAKQKADSTSHRFIEAAYEASRLGKCVPRGYDLFTPEGKNWKNKFFETTWA